MSGKQEQQKERRTQEITNNFGSNCCWLKMSKWCLEGGLFKGASFERALASVGLMHLQRCKGEGAVAREAFGSAIPLGIEES